MYEAISNRNKKYIQFKDELWKYLCVSSHLQVTEESARWLLM